MGEEGILTQRVQGEDYSSQAKSLEKPECAEHGHIHWECHSQSKYQNEYDREEQYRPPTNPKNKEVWRNSVKSQDGQNAGSLKLAKKGTSQTIPSKYCHPFLMFVPFFSLFFLLNPRFLCQPCTDKSISEGIRQRQHIGSVLDLTSIFKTTKINKEASRNYCKAINKSLGDGNQILRPFYSSTREYIVLQGPSY